MQGLQINAGKTKLLGSMSEAREPMTKAKWPCGVCRKGVGAN